MAASICGNSAAMRRAFDGGWLAALCSRLTVNASVVIGLFGIGGALRSSGVLFGFQTHRWRKTGAYDGTICDCKAMKVHIK